MMSGAHDPAGATNALSAAKRHLAERWLRGEAHAGETGIPRRAMEGNPPLSFSQQRLWFLDQVAPQNPFYNVPVIVPLPALTDPALLQRCIDEVVRRHESLRTTFGVVDGKPVQVIAQALPVPIVVHSLRQVAPQLRQAEAKRLVAEEVHRPFDLARGPLFRATLINTTAWERLLLLTLHHIVSDGWSVGLLIEEMTALYAAFAAGRPTPLPDPPIQYADFAVWQRQRLRGELLEKQIGYWTGQLHDLPMLSLPTDRARPPLPSYQGGRCDFHFAKPLTDRLRALAQREGATLFMTMLAGFKCLLHRYTGQSDIVVGAPTAGRTHPDTERLIGFFVNSLVLRTRVAGDDAFCEVLRRVKDVTLEAYSHQDVPFEMLVERLHTARDLSRNPLFQVTFQIANTPASSSLYGTEPRSLLATQQTAIFDLAANLWVTPDGIRGQIEYSSDIFDASTIERLVEHFRRLAEDIVADPLRPVRALRLLGSAEERALLVDWNGTAVRFPHAPCVHEQFAAQAVRTPYAVAVISGGQTITYAALDARANRLARYLAYRTIGRGAAVAVCLERSIDMVVALLGILKSGAGYLPLDPAYPQDRLDYMLHDADCGALVTRERLTSVFTPRSTPRDNFICLDRDAGVISMQSDAPYQGGAQAGDLAYIIYTSGSLGRPKGVMIPHAALTNHMLWMQQRFPLQPHDHVLQRTPFSFDASVWEFFAPLLAGATLVLADPGANLDPAALVANLIRERISILQVVPSLLQMLVEEPDFARCAALRRLFCGGEALQVELVQRVADALDAEVVNLYGPTEATIDATYHVCGEDVAGVAPIGRPIANAHAYVLDPYLNAVPVGVPGELYIGGTGLALGYRGRADLTGERFVADPFRSGQLIYKTGDAARYRRDGVLEFLGRVDHQIKLRGFRIEPGEIEAAIRQHPEVYNAVVVLDEDPREIRRLVAYIAVRTGADVLLGGLRTHLKTMLPEYMLPAAFVMLDSLPLTPNGKIDRARLPAAEGVRPDEVLVEPRNDVEQALARVWSEVLGRTQVGVHDNFFELGGDSILSIQIVARSKRVGLLLTPQDIFQHQTIAELATLAGRVATSEAEQGIVCGSVPLTPVQRWFFEQDRADSHHFNQAAAVVMPHRMQPEMMRDAWAEVFRHHDALRLRFVRDGGTWRQAMAAAQDAVPFENVEMGALTMADAKDLTEATVARLHEKLDLANGPIARAALLSFKDASLLVVVIHHLAVDAVSWPILLEDLLAAYASLVRGEPLSLPAKTTSFKQWSEQCAEFARGARLGEEAAYWLRLRGVRPARMPIDHDDGDDDVGSAQTVVVGMEKDQTRLLLGQISTRYRVPLNHVLLAATSVALARWHGGGPLLVDLEGHGREELLPGVDLSRTVGWFTTISPVAFDLAADLDPAAAIAAVTQTMRAIPNKGIGYGLLRFLSPDPEIRAALAALPRAQVGFNYLGQSQQPPDGDVAMRVAPEHSGIWYSPRGKRTWPIEVTGALVSGRLSMSWTYSDRRHKRSTIEQVAAQQIEFLHALIPAAEPAEAAEADEQFSHSGLTKAELDRLMSKIGLRGIVS